MRFLRTRGPLGASAAVVALSAVAVASYAQFTGPGSGASTVTSDGIGAVTVSSPTVGPLSPQINPDDTTAITVTVDNTGGSSTYVAQITGAVQTRGGCQSWWFTVEPIAPGTITPGEHTYPSSVILRDTDRDQTACLSQTETIDWTARKVALPPPAPKPALGSFGPGQSS